jgi:hypothetical protein
VEKPPEPRLSTLPVVPPPANIRRPSGTEERWPELILKDHQFVVAFGSGRMAETSDKLKFVRHFQRHFALLPGSPAVSLAPHLCAANFYPNAYFGRGNHQRRGSRQVLFFYICTFDCVKQIQTLWFNGGFQVGTAAEKSLFGINEIGKSRGVLRLYIVTGVVSLDTPVMAGCEYPVFNLGCSCSAENAEHAEKDGARRIPHCICRYLSRMFRSFPPITGFFGPKFVGQAGVFGICRWSLPEALSQRPMKIGRFLSGGDQ